MRRWMLFAVVVVACALPASRAAASAWVRPVDGAVARPFDPPLTPYGAGHLGVDFSVPPGTPVRAAGPGVVVFAGSVARSLHVVIRHDGDRRTSYSFLASISVRRGDVVTAGQFVGTTGGQAEHHDGTVLHFGLRVGGRYVDPLVLFGPDAPPDGPVRVHLTDRLPVGRAPDAPSVEAVALERGLPPPLDAPLLCAAMVNGWCA